MKKLLMSILAFGCVVSAQAQGFSGGIKAGLNFANQTYSNSGINITPDGITSFHGGVYFTGMFSEKVGIQPELLYSIQGAELTVGSNTAEDKFGYVNIPVLLRVNIIPAFNIHAGPQLGIVVSAKETLNGTTTDFKDEVNTADFSFAFGAGFDAGKFNGGLRYNLGLSNLMKDTSSGTTVKNNVLQLYVGVKLFGAD